MILKNIWSINNLSEEQVKLLRFLDGSLLEEGHPFFCTTFDVVDVHKIYKSKEGFYRSVKPLIVLKLVKKKKLPDNEKKNVRLKDYLDSYKAGRRVFKFEGEIIIPEKERIRNILDHFRDIGMRFPKKIKKTYILFEGLRGEYYYELTNRGQRLVDMLRHPDYIPVLNDDGKTYTDMEIVTDII